MLKIWVDPDDGPSRQKMIESYGQDVVAHLQEARLSASLVFRESVQNNDAWERVAIAISDILKQVKS